MWRQHRILRTGRQEVRPSSGETALCLITITGPVLVEKTPKEAPLSATELLDAHATTPKAEETASALEEPLIRLHQDQQLTESANEAAQPCDPALIAAGVNESRIDAVFQEPQSTISDSRCTVTQVI